MFIQKYLEMEKDFTDENELFEAVAQILEEERNNKLQNDRPASNIASSFKEVISSKESKSGSNDTDSNSQTISWSSCKCSTVVEKILKIKKTWKLFNLFFYEMKKWKDQRHEQI